MKWHEIRARWGIHIPENKELFLSFLSNCCKKMRLQLSESDSEKTHLYKKSFKEVIAFIWLTNVIFHAEALMAINHHN